MLKPDLKSGTGNWTKCGLGRERACCFEGLTSEPGVSGSFTTWLTGCVSSANSEMVAAVIISVLVPDDFVLTV